ncbi:hypothetical protein NNJEOMEG_02250 [Fundidesulfovibrio magnetotacticus]|uniref:Uncharacterized protein n=1 Tax=Fundidesulfovibrio magnetotacticus TaxID=2730080 RepID=A0A6V8M1S8_9BACT|nr:hypothetical protein [Fundidesulfovibrio magnetotacticus]GFK94405.1 hypothetical protein NNJEOMEG_02250 [Fundidesulfovibrio magnetotacticus]
MSITILHNPVDGVSRDFLASLGLQEPDKDDTDVVVSGQPVRLISDHAKAVAACPGFGCYPVLVYEADGAVHVLNGPTTWQQCLDFMNAPWGENAPPVSREMTRLEFLARFTEAELVLLKGLEFSDPNVGLFWEEWRAATAIRTDDARTVNAVQRMEAAGLIAAGRAAEILGA